MPGMGSPFFRFYIAYVCAGIALTGYDISTPPAHQKAYVLMRDYKVAIMTWFLWPIVAVRDSFQEQILRGRGIRYAFGVLLLFSGLYLLADLAFVFFGWLTSSPIVTSVLSVIVVVILSPLVTVIVMPRWY